MRRVLKSVVRFHKGAAREEKGSLALEQILFIGAIVALSAGLFVFYDNLSSYFSSVGFATAPTAVGSQSSE
jgi:hypothetical protein